MLASRFDLDGRFFLFLMPGYLVVLCLAIAFLWNSKQRWPRPFAAVLYVAICGLWISEVWRIKAGHVWDDGYREASLFIQSGAECAIGPEAEAWQYYFRRPL